MKNAQEAHEAIRPAGDKFRTPDQVRRELSNEEFNLYDLIWKRTVASQMADARGQTVSVRIGADASDGRRAEFATAGTVITFRGFLLAYEEGRDEAGDDAEEKRLPQLSEGDRLDATFISRDGNAETITFFRDGAWLVMEGQSKDHGSMKLYFKKAAGKL